MTEAIVTVEDLSVCYGSATALDRVSLTVKRGEMVALIGPNGAGKSTLVDAMSGVVRPSSGRIEVRGRLAHVPEGRQLFPDLTVDDNLRLGACRAHDRDASWVYDLLPDLAGARRRRADTLSGGQQQMVAFGRALMAQPDVLAIDELSLGLSPLVVRTLVRTVVQLHDARGLSVLLIEQNARVALDICSRGYVLEAGRIVAQGSSAELAASAAIATAYLGGEIEEPTGRWA
ncbi:MAG TPA: ABC transporter ATP-binding protein [Polyangiaceae bacterium]|nr:ABC transporter ATP-binding protein [Polyangiaceae bacterium]